MTRRLMATFMAVALAGAPVMAQNRQAERARPTQGSRGAREEQPRRNIDPQADQVMQRMSDYLSSLRSFRVKGVSIDEVVLDNGQKLQQIAETRLTVQRPNMVRADRVGPIANLSFIYDGRSFNLLGNRTGYYATVAAPATLDAAVDTLRDRYGIDIPAADLLVSHPYDAMMQDVRSGEYIGLEPIDGVPTHHLAFSEPEVDWQIWIQDGPQPLPRRLVITSKTMRSSPQFTAELSNWEPNARIDSNVFAFRPPRDARRIELLPVNPNPTPERQGR